MISAEILAISYGFTSAMVWGAADFSGGLATRRSPVLGVIYISQIIGLTFLFLLALYFKEPIPPWRDIFFGMMAGSCGLFGLIGFYKGLAGGNMGVVAPVTSVVTALIPILLSSVLEGVPNTSKIVGFFLALGAVWLLVYSGPRGAVQKRDIVLSLVAGLGFGLFFIFIDQAGHTTMVWPLVAARISSLTLMSIILFTNGGVKWPDAGQLPIVAATGILDTTGNALFVLATQVGRLDISAALASLCPAVTALMAWVILKEKLKRRQWSGIILALASLVLFTC